MKRIMLSVLSVFFVLFLLNSNAEDVQASENEQFVMPKIYDENDKEIFPYTEEEYKEFLEERETEIQSNSELNALEEDPITTFALVPKYTTTFGKATFSNFVWIKNGISYRNPLYVSVERINRTVGLAIYYYDGNGAYKGKTVFPQYGNIWHSANVEHLARGTFYKFKLVSESGETAQTKQGEIGYNGY